MENSAEVGEFNLKPIIEQTPFEDPAVQKFFGEWCKINDGIRPKFVERSKWEKKGGVAGVLDKSWRGKKILYIPKDLHLWEMVSVMEAVDSDTFSSNSIIYHDKKDELQNLGNMFKWAGIYIAQRLDSVDQGRHLAESMAEQFYDYGSSLVSRRKPERAHKASLLSQIPIQEGLLEVVDRWLAGDEFYSRKRKKLDEVLADHPDKKEEFFEETRRTSLNRYFKRADRSLRREAEARDIDSKPWESAHESFSSKSRSNIQRAMEAPKRELVGSIFRRGMDHVYKNMPFDKLPKIVKESLSGWEKQEKALRSVLEIDELKKIFDSLRRKGNVEELAAAELEFAHHIQEVVSSFPKREGGKYPFGLVSNQEMDCAGASMVGGVLLSELGISYLVADYPNHASLFVVTSTGQVESIDMIGTIDNFALNDDAITGINSAGSDIAVNDVVEFSRDPSRQSLKFDLSSDSYNNFLANFKHRKSPVTVYKPEVGLRLFVLNALGNRLRNNKRHSEAVNCFREAISLDPSYAGSYLNLGATFSILGRTQEAYNSFKKLNELEPNNPDAYYGMGLMWVFSNRMRDALSAFNRFLELADPEIDEKRIENVKRKIDAINASLSE